MLGLSWVPRRSCWRSPSRAGAGRPERGRRWRKLRPRGLEPGLRQAAVRHRLKWLGELQCTCQQWVAGCFTARHRRLPGAVARPARWALFPTKSYLHMVSHKQAVPHRLEPGALHILHMPGPVARHRPAGALRRLHTQAPEGLHMEVLHRMAMAPRALHIPLVARRKRAGDNHTFLSLLAAIELAVAQGTPYTARRGQREAQVSSRYGPLCISSYQCQLYPILREDGFENSICMQVFARWWGWLSTDTATPSVFASCPSARVPEVSIVLLQYAC